MKQILKDIFTVNLADNNDNRRGSVIIFLTFFLLFFDALILLVAIVLWVPALFVVFPSSLVSYVLIIFLVKRGYVTSAAMMMITFIIITSQSPNFYTNNPYPSSDYFISLSIVVAGLTLQPKHVWLVLALNITIILGMNVLVLNSSLANIFQYGPVSNSIFFNVVVAIFSYMSARTIQGFFVAAEQIGRDVSHHVQLLEQQNVLLEQRIRDRNHELRTALQHVEQQAVEYQAVLDDNEKWRLLIREINTPTIPVSDDTLIVPLVGQIDPQRLDEFHGQSLRALVQMRARYLIVDVSGVPYIDTEIGEGLLQLVQAAKLLGSEVLLVGMRPEVARTVVRLGLDAKMARSFTSLQVALIEIEHMRRRKPVETLETLLPA